jgi:excisionase family DNA binding protein
MGQLIGFNRLAWRLRHLGITRDWLREEAKAGRLPSLRIGRTMLFNFDAVVEVIARRAAAGEAPAQQPEEVGHVG